MVHAHENPKFTDQVELDVHIVFILYPFSQWSSGIHNYMQNYSQIPLVSVKNVEIKLKIQLSRFHVDKKDFWCAVIEVFIDFALALCQGQVNTPIVNKFLQSGGIAYNRVRLYHELSLILSDSKSWCRNNCGAKTSSRINESLFH